MEQRLIYPGFLLFLILIPIKFFATATSPFDLRNSKSVDPLIIIDPGHGGRDYGAVVKAPYSNEKKLSLQTAILLKTHLKQLGYRVLLTRESDLFLPLAYRVDIANRAKSAIFISLHYNSSPSDEAHGIEIHYCEGGGTDKRISESKRLANQVLDRMIKRTSAKSRGLKKSDFYVIRNTKMPAILIEGGFLTNIAERKMLSEYRYIDELAKSIAEGVDRFFKL